MTNSIEHPSSPVVSDKEAPTQITFFDWLTPSVAAGQKTITIRDAQEADYVVGSTVEVFTLETNKKVCNIKILSVEPLGFDEIDEFHAEQEAMTLTELKSLIKVIYPETDNLFVIRFSVL